MRLAITGHRPEKIEDGDAVRTNILVGYRILSPEVVIQGMASGVDMWSARLAAAVGIPYWCARPWTTHAPRKAEREEYDNIIGSAAYVHVVTPLDRYPGPWVYQKRNEWMVDKADRILAVWDGSPGGTANCVAYAHRKDKEILRYDPKRDKLEWL